MTAQSAVQRSLGTYVLHEAIGRGGMGVVYRAADRLTGQAVALKQIASNGAGGAGREGTGVVRGRTAQSRALNIALALEFRTLASLSHPHIVQVLDYGFERELGPYLVMELLKGATTILEAGNGLDLEAKISLLIQLLQALTYLHRRGVLHADIKPRNVLVVDGQVKLVDFGIAARTDARDTSAASVAGGTVEYMAPELLRGGPPSIASDLYAVGVVAHQLLAGSYPFDTTSMNEFLSAVLGEEDVTLPGDVARIVGLHVFEASEAEVSRRGAQETPKGLGVLPVPLAAVVRRLLDRAPEQRFATAADVVTELRRATAHAPAVDADDYRESLLQAARFVGREAEFSELVQALESIKTARGAAWLIGGESGVGKSRVLDELRTIALVSEMHVSRGQGVAEASGQLREWLPVLRRMVLAAELGDGEASALSEIIPDLSSLLGRSIRPPPSASPHQVHQRLFAAIETLFRKQSTPLLVLLEDMHWAGTDSIDLLDRLSRVVASLPVLLVATYRDDERAELRGLLPAMAVMKIERFGAEGVAKLSESILGEAGRKPELVAFLQRETEGNAFFAVEVLRALAQGSAHLDDAADADLQAGVYTGGIEKILRGRLDRVPLPCRPLLRLSAVAGRELDTALLRRLMPQIDIDWWLVSCEDAAVLSTHEGGVPRFAHDKLRERLLSELDEGELATLSRRVGEGLEALYGADPLRAATLAQHFERAKIHDKAFHYFVRAGNAAAQLYSVIEARAHFGRALAALDHLPATDERIRQRVDIVVQRASVSWWSTRPDETLTQLHDAEAKLASLATCTKEDEIRLARIFYWIGRGHHVKGEPGRAIPIYREALALSDRSGNTDLWIATSSSIGQSLLIQGRFDDALGYLERAQAPLAERENWPDWCRATGYLGMTLTAAGDPRAGEAAVLLALGRAREMQHATCIASAHVHLSTVLLFTEQWTELAEVGRQCALASAEARDSMLQYLGLRYQAWGLSGSGREDLAAPVLAAARELAETLGARTTLHDWYAVADADHALHRGDARGAISLAKETIAVAREAEIPFAEGLAQRTLARALLALDPSDLRGAAVHVQESLRVHAASGAWGLTARTHQWWAEVLRARPEAARATEANEHQRLADAYAHVIRWRPATPTPFAG